MESNEVAEMNAELKMRARFMFSGGFPSGPARRAFITGMKQERSVTRVGTPRGRKVRTKHPYDAHGVPSTPKDGRTRLCIASDLDSELKTNWKEDK